MAFKRNNNTTDIIKENNAVLLSADDFINSARGETHDNSKKEFKAVNIPLPISTINRLKSYQMTEGKKIETQSYIFNQAVNDWLDKKER